VFGGGRGGRGGGAGAGARDFKFAANMRCNCVVITSVGTREINVDFYTPNGAVIDLGVYRVGP
jgi:hypothetical protein